MLKNKTMFKKMIVMAVCLFYLLSISVSAADIEYKLDGNSLTFTLNVENTGYGTMVYVFDTPLQENDSITDALIEDHLVYAGLAHDSTVSVRLRDDSVHGIYTVVIGSDSLNGELSGRMIYIPRVSDDEISEAMEIINASGSTAALYDNLNLYNSKLYVADVEAAEGYKDMLFDVFQSKYSSSLSSVNDVFTMISDTCAAGMLADAPEGEIAAILTGNAELFGFDADAVDDLSAISSVLYKLKSKASVSGSLSGLKNAVSEATAVAAFNTSDNPVEILRTYNDIFGVNFDSYAFKSISEYELKKRIIELNTKSAAQSAADVKSVFDDAVSALYSENGTKTPSGTGGGIGGAIINNGSYTDFREYDSELVEKNNLMSGPFSDMTDFDWAFEAVKYLSLKGIMNGDGNGAFRPSDPITREEFTKIIITGFEFTTNDGEPEFGDVKSDDWFAPYVSAAVKNKIVNGISDDMFGAGMNITRQDAALIIKRAASACYMEFERKKTLVDFADYDDVSEYALFAVDELARCGIINGFEDNTFRPFGTITRAEAAKLIYECIKNR